MVGDKRVVEGEGWEARGKAWVDIEVQRLLADLKICEILFERQRGIDWKHIG